MLLRLSLTLIALLAVTVAASADPVSLVTAGITALLTAAAPAGTGALTVFGISATTFASGVATAVVAGAAFALNALTGGRRGGIDPGQAKTTFEAGNSGRIRTVGRVRVGGLKIFGNTTGVNRYRLIGHSAGPIDGVEEHFLGGRSVVVEADGTVSSPPFARPTGSYVTIKAKVGDGTETAWTELTGAFPTLWTTDHKVRGIAQSLILYVSPGISTSKFLKLYQSGAPEYERVQRGEKVYDVRSGNTVWSDNAVLVVLHIMLTFPDFALADFDLEFIGIEATKADQNITIRGGGTEARARASGVWDEDGIERGELLRQVLLSTGCEIIARPGDKLGIRLIEDNREGEIAFTADDMIDLAIRYGPEGVERPNICRIKYYSAERNYELAEIDLVDDRTSATPQPLAWAYIQDEIDLVGEKVQEFVLPFCPSASQAQRIGRRLFETARARSGSVTFNQVGLACWGVKTITITPPDLGETLTLEIEPPSVDDEAGTVQVPFVIRPTLSAWNPEVDEALPPQTLPEFEFETTISAPGAATATAVVTYPDTSKASRFVYPDPGASFTVEANYRVITAGIPGAWQSMSEYRAPGGASHAYTATDLAGLSVEFRHRLFNAAEDGSPWSTTTAFTAAVINTAPGVPSLSATRNTDTDPDTADLSLVAPTTNHVASLLLEWSGTGVLSSGSEVIACKPGESFTRSINISGTTGFVATFTLTAKASDGTASSSVTQNIVIP